MACFHKKMIIISLVCFFLHFAVASPPSTRVSKRIHIPFLGLGPRCTGCPSHFCDDDLAIIHGYCCGCARFYDILPVRCGNFIECPLNSYELCEDYEYMMHCCCA